MKLTDESTYQMVHNNLNTFELSDDAGASFGGHKNAIIHQNSKLRSNLK